MSHTPEQALELQCPFAREIKAPNCVSGKCASWRWIPSVKTERKQMVENFPGGGGRYFYTDVPTSPTHGYCGLAGRPDQICNEVS